MFELILISIVISVILTPCGSLFGGKNNLNFTNLSSELIYGIILISFISLALNFFFPLNPLVNTLVLIIPLYFFLNKFNYFFSTQFAKFIILNSIIILLLVTKSNIYRPDAALYHLPYINILNDEKIIFGLSNLHFRFGHISIVQYFSAFLNNIIFQTNGIIFSIAIIASTIIINFISQIYVYFQKKLFNFHFFYLLAIVIFIAYKMNRYSEYGNDAPTHFLFFFLISEIIKSLNKKNNDDVSSNFILSIFILLNKITMSFALILPFIFIKKFQFLSIFKQKKFYFGVIFLSLWIVKNLIVSGCLVYPISKLCIKQLEWTNINEVEYVSSENEAWTKGWPDFNNDKGISMSDYSNDFNWLSTWADNHLKKILEIIVPYIIFLIIIYIFLYFNYKETKKNITSKNYKNNIFLISFMFIFTIIWLLKVPVYRYGYSYLVVFLSLVFSFFCVSNNLVKKNSVYFSKTIIFLCILIFVGKNSYRIFNNYENLNINPIPKIIFNKKKSMKKIKLNDFYYYESIRECGYSFSPCTHYKNINLQSIKILNYNVIINNR